MRREFFRVRHHPIATYPRSETFSYIGRKRAAKRRALHETSGNQRKTRVIKARWASCWNCGDQFDVTLNHAKACCYHPGVSRSSHANKVLSECFQERKKRSTTAISWGSGRAMSGAHRGSGRDMNGPVASRMARSLAVSRRSIMVGSERRTLIECLIQNEQVCHWSFLSLSPLFGSSSIQRLPPEHTPWIVCWVLSVAVDSNVQS